jgi:two-component system cell cycle response regulator
MENSERNQVLIVDDLIQNLKLLERIFTNRGYQVHAVSTSSDAVRIAAELHPDIILLDINMPEQNGYQVCECIKNQEGNADVPIIFISALDAVDDKVRGFQAGAVDYIPKPFEIREVLARVETHLGIRRLQDELRRVNTELAVHVLKLKESQQILHERERKLSAFINALPNLSFVYDQDGRYLEIMAGDASLLRARSEELKGRLITEVMPPGVAEMMMDAIHKVIDTGITQVIEYLLPVLSGKEYWFEGRIALMEKDDDGKGKVVFIATEISERIKLFNEIQRIAIHDSLTNCYNRKHFETLAIIEFKRAARYKHPLALMLMDIDNFKNINDLFGHQFGDRVLCELVNLCRMTLRGNDILGRFGGDEFMILMPETDIVCAVTTAERLRKVIVGKSLKNNGEDINITVSIGVAGTPGDCNLKRPIDSLVSCADEALYAAKVSGRNCVKVYQPKSSKL